jgi:hypothetical protein
MPKPWNEEVYYATVAEPNAYGAGYYGWGNTILEALENVECQGAQTGAPYSLIKIKGDFTVSHFDGSISHQKDGLRYITPKDQPRKFPSNLKKEAKELAKVGDGR